MALSQVRGLSAKVDAGLSSVFEKLGMAITKRPCVWIVATVGLAFAFGPGMGMQKAENNGEKLWTPQDTESQGQQKWVRSTFGYGDRRAHVYSTNGDANVLTYESLKALEALHVGATAVTAKCEVGTCKGKTVNYEHVKKMPRTSALSIWKDRAPLRTANILTDINDRSKWVDAEGRALKVSDMLGGVTYDKITGLITGAECFLTTFWMKNSRENTGSTSEAPWTDAWEMELDDYVQGFSAPGLSESISKTQKGQSQAGGSAIRGDIGMLSMGYFLLIGFSIIVMSHHKRAHSNGMMALACVGGVVLSIISTFGLCAYIGVKTNPVTTTLYLVLLGIGVDDGYVIMGEYQLATGNAQERVVKAVKHAGASIAVTSMTDMVAFAAGLSSSLPALRDFCIFAAIGIFWDFFYQCTFFIAILYQRAKGTESGRPDWCCCVTVDPESTGCCALTAPVCSRGGKCVCCPCTREVDGKTEGLTKRGLNAITNFTMTPIGLVVVAVVTLGMLGGACAGLPNLKTDFDIKWFTPDDHAYQEVFKTQDKYFPSTGGLPVYVFTKSGSYATAHKDGSLSALYARMSADKWIARGMANWYTEFVKDSGRAARGRSSDANFASEVHAFVLSPAGSRFLKDVSFSLNGNGVVSGISGTRSMYFAKPTKDGIEQIALTESTRKTVGDNAVLQAFPFTQPFLYFDGLAVVEGETVRNIISACICVFVVNLIMLADVFAASLVLLMIGLVDVAILGYMAHWGLDFNSVTAINLVLAVGLAVDYSAHIAHSFLVAKGAGADRAKYAVDHIGASVFNGAFSTFLAILPLGLGKSYVFTVFFKMWFMIIIFGAYFGLIVLPVLLRFASPFMGGGAQSYDAEPEASNAEDATKVAPSKDTE